MAEVTEQIMREAPDIEAYKIGLLESAKKLADQQVTIPAQQIAGFSPLQQAAFGQAERGVGAYMPYLTQGGYSLGDSQTALSGIMSGATPFQQEVSCRCKASKCGYKPSNSRLSIRRSKRFVRRVTSGRTI
jgi:hypothetical protein